MEITAAAIIAYMITGLAAASLLLTLYPLRDNSPLTWAAFVLLLPCWPLWAPILGFFKVRAFLSTPSYLKLLRKLDALRERHADLGNEIDDLLEQLAAARNGPVTAGLLAELASKTQDRQVTRRALGNCLQQALSLNARNENWWQLTAPAPLAQGHEPHEEEMSDGDDRVSRITLTISTDSDGGDDWDRRSVTLRLREHLLGTVRLRTGRAAPSVAYAKNRYMRPAEVQSKRWEAVFTSSFRKSLRKAGKEIEEKTDAAIVDLMVNPIEPRGSTIMPLKGNHKGLWRYRIGEFRLVYQPLPDAGELRLISLTHRSRAY